MEIESKFHLIPLGIIFGLAACFLDRSFKCTQTTNLIHDSFCVQFGLQTLECAINGFTFFNDNFWHKFTYFLPSSMKGALKLVIPTNLVNSGKILTEFKHKK